MSRNISLPFSPTNRDAPVDTDVVDVSSNDFTAPSGKIIRCLNIAVAGDIYLTDLAGRTAKEYLNTGWVLCTPCTVVKNNVGNTATVRKCGYAGASVVSQT